MKRTLRKLISVGKIFTASFLCVFMFACGNNESQANGEQEQDSVVQADEIHVDWESVEQAQRINDPSTPEPEEAVQRLTVMDFSATWCGPCKGFAPIFHEVAEEYKDQADFRTIDIDQERDMAEKYNIQAVPTIVILDANGKELKRVEGAMTKRDLIGLIKELQ